MKYIARAVALMYVIGRLQCVIYVKLYIMPTKPYILDDWVQEECWGTRSNRHYAMMSVAHARTHRGLF